MKQVIWRWSNETAQWQTKEVQNRAAAQATLRLDGREYQTMHGFGGCFNELGWSSLQKLSSGEREAVMQELFLPGEERANLNFCRLPIGGNDYSFDWYSLDETAGDYELKDFSLERDRKALIPYIKAAKKYAPDLRLFASPWSPPTWMKEPPVYNWGKIIRTPEIWRAYADYFVRFITSYKQEGIEIEQIHVQNEPVANQKFPSCMWTGEELRDFIRDYLGPALRRSGVDTELWLGTINAPGCDYNRLIFDKWATEDYDYFANTVLLDPDALQYISGVSYQWGGKIAIQRTYESWAPRIRLMQSENECGFGDNTWEYARYVWTMLKHYIGNGAESYLYWNLVLEPMGRSTWGDPQNAMITADPQSGEAIYNPDFYVMKHFSSVIQRGAVRLGAAGTFAADSLVFRNPDGAVVLELHNPLREVLTVAYEYGGETWYFPLEPQSVNSVVLS
ncbi:glycoside hydrolase family 30 protein [Lachnoclostridium sp. Marseille-P6806]|uniref:glycoside hydrolase family 30 protein n=1 Tax=Lachnoclostridium sp. Marseille-P6806 TaxID=2364793 RepID=UPI0010321364|nr:glycosyl hydrolase [Lachnoclostridium sp. Marseille-P6806]